MPKYVIAKPKYWLFAAALCLPAHFPLSAHAETPASDTQKGRALADPPLAAKVPSSLIQMGVHSNYYSPYALVVDKSQRLLTIWEQEKDGYRQVAQYPTDLGKKAGDKQARDDHRTPEGIYFLLDKLEGPSLDFSQYGQRAFTTDYPNFFDRIIGKTGSGIWLHAVPDEVPLTRGSRGCVVVRNEVVMQLHNYIKLQKTPILIYETIEMSTADKLREKSLQLTQFIESWRQAWESKDIDSYIKFYSERFNSMKMNRAEWKTYKERLNSMYDELSIKLSRPVIFNHKDEIVVRFLQAYSSDRHADFGEKRLYLKYENGNYRIVGEEWAADSSRMAREEIEAAATTSVSSSVAPFSAGN